MHVVDDIKTRGVTSTSLTIMGVAVTVTVKCSFCKTVSLLTCVFYRLSIAYVTLTISLVSQQQQFLLDVSFYRFNC